MNPPTTNPTLVIRPECGFERIAAALARAGWERAPDTSAAPPLVPGEPEFASWSRGEEGRVSYTFNPVARLRVLVFYGPGAAGLFEEAGRSLPTLGLADLRELLQAADARRLLLGIFAARTLGAFMVLDLLEPLREHGEGAVARAASRAHEELAGLMLEVGAARLREEKRRHPGRSVLFPRLGDRRVRRQTLRWLIRDRRESNEHIEEVLRSGLSDEDWEVRATAILAAARLRAKALGAEVRRAELPRTSREGPDETDRTILFAARKVVLSYLAGDRPAGVEEDDRGGRDALHLHLWRCVTGEPVERHDRIFLFINALAEPLEVEEDEPPAPDFVVADGENYRLRRTGLEVCRVAALPHWLGGDDHDLALPNPIRRLTPPAAFFIARRPLSVAEVLRLDPRAATAAGVGARDEAGAQDGDRPYLCGRAEAARLCELLGRSEGVEVRLPGADEWEMAARGTDGRRYPWGNGYEGDPRNLSSPWGLERVACDGPEWTGTQEAGGRPVLCGGVKEWRCAARMTADASTPAVVRPVFAY